MDYFSIMQKVREGVPLQRVQIEGGQTEGRIKFDEPQRQPRGKTIMSGLQYADESKARDKLEELMLDREQPKRGMNEVESVSVGTLPNIQDIHTEYSTQVYEIYSFNYKPQTQLLVTQHKDEILDHIATNQVTIIKGATGCGKTTQVPQFILDYHQQCGIHCNIIITQPRRIAAISVARRVSEQRNWQLGTLVGYQIGLEKKVNQDTRMLFVTTGVLLQILVRAGNLNNFTHIIVDEVHERDSETDFLLIVLLKLLRHPQCRTKVVLMSATLDTDQFVKYFTRTVRGVEIEPPVVELSIETNYPVSFYYLDGLRNRLSFRLPEVSINSPTIEPAGYDLAIELITIFNVIDEHEHNEPFLGSVLVFLPGLAEIENMYKKLMPKKLTGKEKLWICPLHSSVTYDEQLKVFQPPPPGHRKIILATNIAESSITVPDIKYVIDFCLARQQVIDRDTGYSGLELNWISKSQGTQRAGRVGRVMPGRVYRLVPKAMYMDLPVHSVPEIIRCPLDQLVLQAKLLDMGSPEHILGLAIDPPDLSNIHKTILILKQAGALRLTVNKEYKPNDGDLTYIGHIMAHLPLDISLSRLIILGYAFSVLDDAIIMASALSLKSIFSTPFQAQLMAYISKLTWAAQSCSDPIAFINAFNLWKHKTNMGLFRRTGSESEAEWCKKHFIQRNVIREVDRLQVEIEKRLDMLGVEIPRGDARIVWSKPERSFILKLVIAGAFYPNYFIPINIDEKEAVKTLSGRDPYSSVYLTGFPMNQPGPLYAPVIKDIFKECGSAIDVTFEASSKVYLQFGSSLLPTDPNSDKPLMPGKIMLAVYRAIKYKQLQLPITIPMLLPHDSKKRFEEIFGEGSSNLSLRQQLKRTALPKNPLLPSLETNILSVTITHVDNPSSFWIKFDDEHTDHKFFWMHKKINNSVLPPYQGPMTEGSLCIAPYEDNAKTVRYYRARIVHQMINHRKTDVLVFFIDFGNSETCCSSTLKDFPEEFENIKNEPGLAIKCSLAEIGPSQSANSTGDWSREASENMRKYFPFNLAVAKVYSVVNNLMTVTLFTHNVMKRIGRDHELSTTHSFNHYLIECGLAEPIDEPYLSRENHLLRETAEQSSGTVRMYSDAFEQPYRGVEFSPPSKEECRIEVSLKGPKSPLETHLYCITKKCQGKETTIEWNSVNSVLLDTFPQDPHQRLIVAASASQNSQNRLTLRNTTAMPNIHGLPALMCLLFAPRVELRADKARKNLTGALCGLGFDPETDEPFFGENDIEITFDTKFTLLDLELVNKVRFWLGRLLSSEDGPETCTGRPTIKKAQAKLKEYVTDLFSKQRPSAIQGQQMTPFVWNQIPSEDLLDPNDEEDSIFPLIWGIELRGQGTRDHALANHLETLHKMASGQAILRSGTQCELCQVYLQSVPDIRLHIATTLHKTKAAEFNATLEDPQGNRLS